MCFKSSLVVCFFTLTAVFQLSGANPKVKFDPLKDILIVQYDCKTDVDDLHTAAAFASLMAQPEYKHLNWHAVTGTYGIQEGLYVPPNPLMKLAYNSNWTDAHNQMDTAVEKVFSRVKTILNNGGAIWIAEAGQSDFSALLVRKVQSEMPEINMKKSIHIVQHSEWNEKMTTPEELTFLKATIDYIKIPDGNAEGNGTPGFKSPDFSDWHSKISNEHLKSVWQLAVSLGNQYNAKDGRYNNTAVEAGGLDFSDLSEVCWILGIADIYDTAEFFERFLQ